MTDQLPEIVKEIIQARRGLLQTAAALERLANILKICYSDDSDYSEDIQIDDNFTVAGLS